VTRLVGDAPPRARLAADGPWLAAAVLLALAPAVFWQGGVIEEEALGFLRNYWGERPALVSIFDLRSGDDYQGRELSYAIDYLDAQWVRFMLSRGILFFVPPSGLLAALAVAPIGLWLVPRALPGLGRATRWLVLLAYTANFAVASTTATLYRATKPLVAPLLLALLLVVLAEHRRSRLRPPAAFGVVLAAGLVASLLDQQGLFYVGLLTLALAAAWVAWRRGLALALGGIAAVGLWLLYDRVLGPWIIHSLNGYWVAMRFQRLRPQWLLDLRPWGDAARLLGDWTRVLLGGLPGWAVGGLGTAAAAAWAWRERRRPRKVALAAAVALLAGGTQLAMLAIMVERHPPVAWVDHRFWYYPLPFQALLVFLSLWGLERLSIARGGALPVALPTGLGLLVLVNVLLWPHWRQAMESGPWFSHVARRSAQLVRSWRLGQAELLLDGDYRRFYFESLDRFPKLGGPAPQVGEGDGFGTTEVVDGRVVAWAEGEAHLLARAYAAGRYVMEGSLHLRATDRVILLLGSRRFVAEVERKEPTAGVVRFRTIVDLVPGPNDILLLPRLPAEPPAPPSNRPRAFALFPPVTLRPEAASRTEAPFRSDVPAGRR
jgi:hypothetical protein